MTPRDVDPPAADTGSDLTPVYVRVLVIEALVLGALFWLGRHFA